MTEALVPRSQTVAVELSGQDDLIPAAIVARCLVATAETGTAHGGQVGVQLAVLPGRAICYLLSFTLGLLWGFVLGVLSLLGAALYGLRCLGRWICRIR
jgi:hypothetical protein